MNFLVDNLKIDEDGEKRLWGLMFMLKQVEHTKVYLNEEEFYWNFLTSYICKIDQTTTTTKKANGK